MKKIITALIIILFAEYVSAQSLIFEKNGERIEPGRTEIIVNKIDDYLDFYDLFQYEFNVINNTTEKLNVQLDWNIADGSSELNMTWGHCFHSSYMNPPVEQELLPNSSLSFDVSISYFDINDLHCLLEYSFYIEETDERYSFELLFQYQPIVNVGDKATISYNDYALYFYVTNTEPVECSVGCESVKNGNSLYNNVHIIIPSTVSINNIECTVTTIINNGFGNNNYKKYFKQITIPNTITHIGNSAFRSSNTYNVFFEENSKLVSIGEGAFNGCDNLSSIQIPNTVTSIGDRAFNGCNKLASITFEDNSQITSIGNYVFYDCWELNTIHIPSSVVSIGSNAFACDDRGAGLETITFEENSQLVSIGSSAFKGSRLKSIEIPSSVTSIESSAFEGCGLTEIKIPDGITSIKSSTFAGCYSLKIVEIPYSVTTIEYNAFGMKRDYYSTVNTACKNLSVIEIPDGVTYIGENAFEGSGLTKIIIPESVTTIESKTFKNCSKLVDVTIPNTVTSIGDHAFSGCVSLMEITIPNSVTSIGAYAFSGEEDEDEEACVILSNVIFEENSKLVSLGTSVFGNCSDLKTIVIPRNVTNLGTDIFFNCYNLTNVTFEEDSQLSSISSGAFYNCSRLKEIVIPKNVNRIGGVYYDNSYCDYYGAFENCTKLKNVYFEDNSELTSIEAAAFRGCTSLVDFIIPKGVSSIGGVKTKYGDDEFNGPFEGCSSLEKLSFEEGSQLKQIKFAAFVGCPNLKSIIIPASVTSIEGISEDDYCCGAFSKEMETIIFEDDSMLKTIGVAAFKDVSISHIDIPNSVKSIADYAFSGCDNLKSLRCFPENVPATGESVFQNCPDDMIIQVQEQSIDKYKVESPWNEFFITKIYPYVLGESSTVEYDGYKLKFTICNLDMPSCEVSCAKAPDSLMSIEIPATAVIADATFNVTKIADNGFANKSNITGVNFPSTLTSIGNNAFANCSDLERLFFGNNLIFTTLGENAFADCTKLSAIDMPSNVTTINKGAFKNCIAFKNIILPNYVSTIADSAFYNCSNLTSLNLPQFVNSIGNKAFSNCSNLISLKCHAENVPTTAESAFDNLPNNMIIQVPPTSVGLYNKVSPWNKFSVVGGFSYLITAAPNDYSYGIVSGAGTYNAGANVTLVANPLQSSIFDYWTENGMVVSTDAEYSFTIERDRILIANFNSRHWNADKEQYSGKMSMMAKVEINGQEQNNPYLEVGAFCGDEVRGSQRLKYIGNNRGSFLLEMDIFGKDNDVISFKLFDHEKNIELNLFNDEDIKFDDKGSLGSENTPYIISFNEKNDDNDDDANEDEDGNEDGNDTPTPKPLDAPENIEAKALSSSSIMLTWDHVEDALKYHVYQDDEFIAIVEETEFLVEGLEAETRYCFYVTAVNDSIESDESDEDCARTKDGEGINELSSSINIYPNPVDNELILATELRVEEIAIYDIYGRMTTVYGLQTTDFIHTIDVADLEAGVYFVNIKTENGNIVKRFIKN